MPKQPRTKKERKQTVSATLPEIPMAVKPARAKRVLTPEQRQVLIDRLEVARSARKAKLALAREASTSESAAVDPSLADLPL